MGGEVSAGAGLAGALFGVLWDALAVICCVVAVIALAVALLSLRWHLRRSRALRTPTQPSRIMPEIGDDVIAMLTEHRRYPDETFAMDGLTDALRRMTEEDGR